MDALQAFVRDALELVPDPFAERRAELDYVIRYAIEASFLRNVVWNCRRCSFERVTPRPFDRYNIVTAFEVQWNQIRHAHGLFRRVIRFR